MKVLNFFILFLLIVFSSHLDAQICPNPGDSSGKHGCPDTTKGCGGGSGGIGIPIQAPGDPNEIIGSLGYSTPKWVSVNASLPYKISFENDPAIATAPAQKVIIYMPIHPNLNPNTLRIGDFGFGSSIFTVPPNSTSYTKRLDGRINGVIVDVTAGLDLTNHRAFWIFESIDTATGLAGTVPANAGFLPVNDSTKHNGEGFVSFNITPASTLHTGDSVSAQASIIFDNNEIVPTNVWTNIVDAVAPTSKLNSLPPATDYAFVLSWTGKDDNPGSGVKYYDVYVSKNNGAFSLYQEKLDTTATSFTGDAGAIYSFYTIATDNTGNRQTKDTSYQSTTIKGYGVYVSAKAFLQGAYQPADNTMTDNLRTARLLPSTDPYPSLGFTPINNPALRTVSGGVLDSTGDMAITDWIWLELRSNLNPSQVLAARSALIRRDGNVVDMDGVSPVYFNNVSEGNYYVDLRHRNHLGVMTATALSFTKITPTVIDFTSPSTPTYGIDAQQNIKGIMTMRAGDVTGDRRVNYNGSSNDKNAVLAKVGLATPNNVITTYDRADVNLDGTIRYNGANNDKNVILATVGLTTANNVVTEQIPD
jgi:hypothetical protein